RDGHVYASTTRTTRPTPAWLHSGARLHRKARPAPPTRPAHSHQQTTESRLALWPILPATSPPWRLASASTHTAPHPPGDRGRRPGTRAAHPPPSSRLPDTWIPK